MILISLLGDSKWVDIVLYIFKYTSFVSYCLHVYKSNDICCLSGNVWMDKWDSDNKKIKLKPWGSNCFSSSPKIVKLWVAHISLHNVCSLAVSFKIASFLIFLKSQIKCFPADEAFWNISYIYLKSLNELHIEYGPYNPSKIYEYCFIFHCIYTMCKLSILCTVSYT
jgi:hypothetical protein